MEQPIQLDARQEAAEDIIRAVETWCDAQVPDRVRAEIERIIADLAVAPFAAIAASAQRIRARPR